MKRLFKIALAAILLPAAAAAAVPPATVRDNPPPSCGNADPTCGCPSGGDDGAKGDGRATVFGGNHGDAIANGCVKIDIGMGRTTPWSGSFGAGMRVFADDGAPNIFGVESLRAVVGGYALMRLGQRNLADNETPSSVVFAHPNGETVEFAFSDGDALGRPKPGVHDRMAERVEMVDASGLAATNRPAYYDLLVGDGTRRRFVATDAEGRLGDLVSITDARGVVTTPADMGVDVVRGPGGVRQFLTPSRLAVVTPTADWRGYDIAVHAVGDAIPAKDASTGLYDVPAGSPARLLSVRCEDGGGRAVATVRRGGGDPLEYAFDYVMGEWTLTRPSGVRDERESLVADSHGSRRVDTVRKPGGEPLSRTESNYRWMPWGYSMTNRVEGFGGATGTTTWTYYTTGDARGQIKSRLGPSGHHVQYTYDPANRTASETHTGPGMMAGQIAYSYEPVDPADAAQPVDARPRTVVRTLGGVECARAYHVYSPLTGIVERAAEPGAPYGSAGALRTVTAYWPPAPGDPRSGLVRSVRHENGALDLYGYGLSSNVWTRTVTHLHELSPEPVDGRTTRDITVANRRGETLETRTEAFVGGGWRAVARERRAFDAEGRAVRSEDLAGQVTTTAWDCCRKVAETRPDGSATTWDYDVEGRVVASSRLIPLDMTNVTWLTTCHEYDGLGRETATWRTNYAARAGTPATLTAYDALGRVVARVDELGNATATAYGADGRTVTTTAPGGAATVHVLNARGDTLSVDGAAVTPEFHEYSVEGNCRVHAVRHGSATSPRLTRRFENMLGQTVREERSGFRGALLATTHSYDAYGRLASSARDGEPTTEYAYDALGDRVSATRVAGGSGEWRRAATRSSFALVGGDVWLVSATTNSCSDPAIAPLTTSTAQQLTGLSAAAPARSLATDVRGNASETTLSVAAPDVTESQSVPYAAGARLALSRYGVELRTVSASCVTNTFAYDALGRRVAVTDGRGNTTRTEYDAIGRRAATIDALGNRTEYAYDGLGNLASVTDPLGNATVYEYDLRGRKTCEGGATYPVRYTYDVFGNLATLSTTRDPAANQLANSQLTNSPTASWDTTTWLYDEASGAVTGKTYADGKGPSYEYTPEGRLSRRTWARGITTDYTYDAWGSLTNTVYSDGTPAVSMRYDAMGRQVEVRDAAGVATFAYDAFGSLTNETVVGVAGTNTIERCWDEFGRTTGHRLMQNAECGMQNGGGNNSSTPQPFNPSTVTYSYDTLGRFGSVGFNAEAQSRGEFEYQYLAGSDLISAKTATVRQNSSLVTRHSSLISYEPYRDLISAVTNSFSPAGAIPHSPFSIFNYQNDAAGRRVSRLDTFGGAATGNAFGYNARSEVTSALMGTNAFGYAYDPIGNRVESSQNAATNLYAANALNQYTTISNLCASVPPRESSLAYDADGNTTSDGRFTYFWNGENRLVCASNAEYVVTYAYDHRGRMARKDVARTANSPFSILHYAFVWDDWNIIRESLTTNHYSLTTDYVWGLDLDGTLQGAGGVGGLLAVVKSDCAVTNSAFCILHSALYFPTYDANGNVSEYISTNGEIVAHYEYSAFGEPLVASGPLASAFTHQFSTKPYCAVTGFSEYQMRKYNPEIGRWMSRDPIGENGGVNIYSICVNNMQSWFDYIGLDTKAVLARCNELATKINKREHTGLPRLDRIIDLAKEYKCKEWTVSCKECDEDCSYEGYARRPFLVGDGCVSKICVNKNHSSHDIESTLIHEMTHCLQYCRKIPSFGCESCLCLELQAYDAENPNAPDNEIIRRAKKSCTSGLDAQCYSERQMAHFLKKPNFVKMCRLTGNRNVVGGEANIMSQESCGVGICRAR